MTHKYGTEVRVRYNDVYPDFAMRLSALFQYLYQLTLDHRCPFCEDILTLHRQDMGWFVRQMALDLAITPVYNDVLKIETWIAGAHKARLFRKHNIYLRDRQIGALTSEWIYMDLEKRRPRAVPKGLTNSYNESFANPFEQRFPSYQLLNPMNCTISVRSGDFDSNGHVNNTIYLDYLETACNQCIAVPARIKHCKIFFVKEIPRSVDSIAVALAGENPVMNFRMADKSTLYAAGEIRLQ